MTRPKFDLDKPTSSASQNRNEKTHRINKYKLVGGHDDHEAFEKQVNGLLKKGWHLFGPPFAHGDYHNKIFQALIKY
jgi:hypothetical protein